MEEHVLPQTEYIKFDGGMRKIEYFVIRCSTFKNNESCLDFSRKHNRNVKKYSEKKYEALKLFPVIRVKILSIERKSVHSFQ